MQIRTELIIEPFIIKLTWSRMLLEKQAIILLERDKRTNNLKNT